MPSLLDNKSLASSSHGRTMGPWPRPSLPLGSSSQQHRFQASAGVRRNFQFHLDRLLIEMRSTFNITAISLLPNAAVAIFRFLIKVVINPDIDGTHTTDHEQISCSFCFPLFRFCNYTLCSFNAFAVS